MILEISWIYFLIPHENQANMAFFIKKKTKEHKKENLEDVFSRPETKYKEVKCFKSFFKI